MVVVIADLFGMSRRFVGLSANADDNHVVQQRY